MDDIDGEAEIIVNGTSNKIANVNMGSAFLTLNDTLRFTNNNVSDILAFLLYGIPRRQYHFRPGRIH